MTSEASHSAGNFLTRSELALCQDCTSTIPIGRLTPADNHPPGLCPRCGGQTCQCDGCAADAWRAEPCPRCRELHDELVAREMEIGELKARLAQKEAELSGAVHGTAEMCRCFPDNGVPFL